MFIGKSGETMRICICRFIECISLTKMNLFDYY